MSSQAVLAPLRLQNLEDLIRSASLGLRVEISQPYGYSGQVFNVDDVAFLDVAVHNDTTFKFRDVVVQIKAVSGVTIYPFSFLNMLLWDGVESWDEFEPHAIKSFNVRIKGVSPGTAEIKGDVSGELVPYATHVSGYSSFSVTAT